IDQAAAFAEVRAAWRHRRVSRPRFRRFGPHVAAQQHAPRCQRGDCAAGGDTGCVDGLIHAAAPDSGISGRIPGRGLCRHAAARGEAVTDIGQPATWVEENQRYLVAELLRLRRRISGEAAADDSEKGDSAAPQMSPPAAIDVIADIFELSPFERDTLLLCAGMEMDAQFAAACAKPNGERGACFATALGALDQPHWSALTPARPLRRWRLIEVEPNQPLIS